jgi:hypothetical protein
LVIGYKCPHHACYCSLLLQAPITELLMYYLQEVTCSETCNFLNLTRLYSNCSQSVQVQLWKTIKQCNWWNLNY